MFVFYLYKHQKKIKSMKRDYVKPTAELVECECLHMIAASSEQLENGGDIPTTKPSNSNVWGDIWNK